MHRSLILILIDVQYLQNSVFSFEKGSNCQIHSSSGSYHLVKKIPPPAEFLIPPTFYCYLENSVVTTVINFRVFCILPKILRD